MDAVEQLKPGALSAKIRKERRGSGRTPFVLDVAFDITAGFTILFGASGSGKSTLLDCLAGLVRPDAGRIAIGGDELFDAERNVDVPTPQRKVGYVFQSLALFPHLSIEQNVLYGLQEIAGKQRRMRVREILERFRLEKLAKQKPGDISGGEKQRAALARSLVTEPRLLLLDEPLSGLDNELRASIIEDLRDWNGARNIPILYVTHSRDEAEALGERMIALDHGVIVSRGLPRDVLDAPRRQRVAQIAGFENLLEGTVKELRESDGVMRVQLTMRSCEIEVPLSQAAAGERVRVAVRAGDILLATVAPQKLSARNVLAGTISSLEERAGVFEARVDCGAEFVVHVTKGAVRELELAAGKSVWLVLKTHSCHLVNP